MARVKNQNWKTQELFNQSYEVQLTSLVIYGLRDGHTHNVIHKHTHTYLHKSDYKKPGKCQLAASVRLAQKYKIKKEVEIDYITHIKNKEISQEYKCWHERFTSLSQT